VLSFPLCDGVLNFSSFDAVKSGHSRSFKQSYLNFGLAMLDGKRVHP